MTHFDTNFPPEIRPPQGHSDFPIKRKQQHTLNAHHNNVTCDSYRCAQVKTPPPGSFSRLPSEARGSRSYSNQMHPPIDPNPELNSADITPPLALLPPKARHIAGIDRTPGSAHWTGWVSPIHDFDSDKTREISAPAEN